MNKYIYIITTLLLSTTLSFAQSNYQKATDAQAKEIVRKMAQASETMKSMKCEFTQTKEVTFINDKVTSQGNMFFKYPNKIRWEYTKPYEYVFSMDGKNIRMSSGNTTNKIPVKSSKIFNEISNILIGGISGNGLINSPDFTTQFNVGKEDNQLILIPQKKEIKDLFSAIQLYVGKTDTPIHKVELIEKSGDKTTIQLNNIQLNAIIQDDIFYR